MPYIGKSPSAGVRQRYQYTATGSQTTFSGTDLGNLTLTYTDNNFVDVYQNGVLLKGGGADYTATSGTSVVLGTGATADDVIEIIVYDVFSVGNFFNRTDSDSRYLNVAGDTMTGSLDLNGTELVLDVDGDTSITSDTDDQVDIKIGGTDRFSIASTGATTITTAGNESTLSLVSTDADASLGPVLDLHRNSASPADDDAIGRLVFSGENDASEKIDLVKLIGLNSDVTDGTEDGRLQLYIHKDGSSINRMDFQPTETVFNDDSANVDFRVESDGNANMLVVDAGTNRVAIGGSGPASILNVSGDDANFIGRFYNDGNDANRSGLFVQTGTDDGSGTVDFFTAYDGDGSHTGSIRTVSGVFQVVDVSDQRLKQDIVDTSINGLNTINALQIRDFAYKKNPTETVKAGFIAQELQKVFPDAVTEDKDRTDDLKQEYSKILGVSRDRLVPVLVKAVQELSAKNDALEARIKKLEDG